MTDRPRAPLAFGGGVDRSTGPMLVEPSSFLDERNVQLSEGWMSARKGLLELVSAADFVAEGVAVTHVVGVAPVRSQGINVIITFDSGGGTCAAWLFDEDLATTTYIGSFWTIADPALSPPIVSLADSFDKLFVAHDEPDQTVRQITQVVDIVGMAVADLAIGGDFGSPKFRGVRRYLMFLFGWGYGTDAEPDRPEVVRVSAAGDPMSWNIDHYFIAGQRGDPVLSCDRAGKVLNVRKQTESYDIIGFSRDTFGIVPGDDRFGIAGSQLAATVGTVSYFWSLEGPRASSGPGESEDLSVLLALSGAAPDPAAAGLDYVRGFAVYQPVTREVRFVFGTWAYVLHLADPGRRRWSFAQYGVPLACGGNVFKTEDTLGPAAAARMTTSIVTDTTITQTADFIGGSLLGGETAEWWLLDPTTHVWVREATRAVPSMAMTIAYGYDPLLTGTVYTLAVRLKRNGLSGAGYTSNNPFDWPSTSRITLTTGGTALPADAAMIATLSETAHDSGSITLNGHLAGTLVGNEAIRWYMGEADNIAGDVSQFTPAPALADNPMVWGGLDAATSYLFFARVERLGVPTPPYASANPYDWPPESGLSAATDP